jgi:hypothetical protein
LREQRAVPTEFCAESKIGFPAKLEQRLLADRLPFPSSQSFEGCLLFTAGYIYTPQPLLEGLDR